MPAVFAGRLLVVAASLVAAISVRVSAVPAGAAEPAAPAAALAAAALAPTSRFVALAPVRLADTRDSGAPLPSGGALRVGTGVAGGAPADATAVVVNVTATATTGPGYLTVWSGEGPAPLASNLNVDGAGRTLANLAIVPVAADGGIAVFTQRATHVVVDLLGAFVPAPSAAAGRLVAQRPTRVLDTRDTTALAPDEVRVVDLGDAARTASAAVVNLTAVDARAPGFVTAWAAGSPLPATSNVNVDHAGQTVANLAIVPLADGRFAVRSHSAVDLVVDVAATFTGTAAPDTTDGLFVPLPPTRVVDTRQRLGADRLTGGHRTDLALAGHGGIPSSGAAAVVLNATATETSQPGFVTVYPAATRQPLASNLNAERSWQSVPNLVVAPLGATGAVSVTAQHTGHLVADASGWFTGAPVAPDPDEPLTAGPPPTPVSGGVLVPAGSIGGAISPKSVVATGGGLVFAQNMMYTHTITVYDRAGGLVATIPDRVDRAAFGQAGGVQQGAPVEAALAADGRSMYVSNYSMYGAGAGPAGFDGCSPGDAVADSTVYRVDLATLAIADVIPVGRVPKFLATSPDGRWLVVSNWCGNDVSIVDVTTGAEVRRVPVGRYPRGLAITGDSTTAYVALMGEGRLAMVDLASGSVSYSGRVGGGTRHLNLSPDGRWLYVTLNEEASVAKVDTTTLTVVARVGTGAEPRSASLAADGAHLYVVNYESASASAIRTSDMAVVQTVATAHHPIGITYDSETRQLFVACYDGRILLFDER